MTEILYEQTASAALDAAQPDDAQRVAGQHQGGELAVSAPTSSPPPATAPAATPAPRR